MIIKDFKIILRNVFVSVVHRANSVETDDHCIRAGMQFKGIEPVKGPLIIKLEKMV